MEPGGCGLAGVEGQAVVVPDAHAAALAVDQVADGQAGAVRRGQSQTFGQLFGRDHGECRQFSLRDEAAFRRRDHPAAIARDTCFADDRGVERNAAAGLHRVHVERGDTGFVHRQVAALHRRDLTICMIPDPPSLAALRKRAAATGCVV
ncbi:MAG: hypothetical protein FJ197_02325 [Gammaproteobacteria bacterium]|nr:hypothetical protein [Gammaproteobacteria bacterium]